MYPLPTLKEFLDNPMGKGSTAIVGREAIKDSLKKRYNKLRKDKGKKFDITIYQDDDDYYFHIIIPSESERRNTYDIVLHFTVDEDKELKYDNFLRRYYIKFFSNCPSFTYTFAQTFHQYGFLIEVLANKFDKEVLSNEPIIRNPGQIVSFEKSLYYACLYIQDSFILKNKMYLNQMAKQFSAKVLGDAVRTTDAIDMEIKKENVKVKEKKKEEKKDPLKALKTKSNIDTTKKTVGVGKISAIAPKKKIGARRSGRKT